MLQENLTEIKSRIAAAASRVNRAPADIKLVAVTKRVLPENIIRAIELN